jgi:hypothetical protein
VSQGTGTGYETRAGFDSKDGYERLKPGVLIAETCVAFLDIDPPLRCPNIAVYEPGRIRASAGAPSAALNDDRGSDH